MHSAHTTQVVDLAAARERAAHRPGPRPPRSRLPGPHRAAVGRPLPPLRLTRRGRAVVVVVAALAITAALMLVLPRASIAWWGEPPRGHLVLAGEAMWEIAVAFDPAADTRAVVDRLRRINHLCSVELTPGQFLLRG
ncbi:LysM peptidoglycan-binding domain-containing protein [Frankia gtarii]|uniref:LysM peptidoglycan-binding domain-containing protein n=1 Tax=Frankia gtarii TaxID=2950102 RepID=UPI0021BF3208|nr:LysM peptidoglycan-binding domain-containing protein [Frankia gtarii]